jgi:peptide deformylase
MGVTTVANSRQNAVGGHTGPMPGGDALPIVACGDPILRRRAEPVDPAALRSRELRRLIVRMKATMEEAPGVGLAAPQIGEPIQLAVVQDGPDQWRDTPPAELDARGRTELPFTVLVNPVLVPATDDGTVAFYEGCLSVPGFAGVVARHRYVRVDGLDEHGEPRSLTFTGWPARIAQHEVDHLLGVLYLDRVQTRSLSTVDNYLDRWARRPTVDAAAALGFAAD